MDRRQKTINGERMKQRERNRVVKVAHDELEMLHAIADAGDESIARVVRRWIVLNYKAAFGEKAAPKVVLKNTRA